MLKLSTKLKKNNSIDLPSNATRFLGKGETIVPSVMLGGVFMTCGWTGIYRPILRKVLSSNYKNLPLYPHL